MQLVAWLFVIWPWVVPDWNVAWFLHYLFVTVIRWADGIKIRNSTDIDIVIFDKNLLEPSASHLQRTNNVGRVRWAYSLCHNRSYCGYIYVVFLLGWQLQLIIFVDCHHFQLTYRISVTYNDVDELMAIELLSSYNLTIHRDAPYASQVKQLSFDLYLRTLQPLQCSLHTCMCVIYT